MACLDVASKTRSMVSLQRKIFCAPGTLVPHKKKIFPAAPGACSEGSSDGTKYFYLIFDCLNQDPCSFVCVAMNKSTGEATPLTISPSPHAKKHHLIFSHFTAVALGPTIYLIGGYCHPGFCPDGKREVLHQHAEVIFFDTLGPDQGWMNAPPMRFPRAKPTAVVIDGKIYVFGGSDKSEDGEFFDPKTKEWRSFPASGFQPFFPCIHVPHVDSDGVKSVLVHSDHGDAETLHRYLLVEQKWEIVSRDFGECSSPGAILGDIIYAVLDGDDEEKPLLHGYHLVHKRWFPVDLPLEIYDINSETACVFASGNDRLCLVWYHFDAPGGGKDNRMECLELQLNQTTESDGTTLLNLSATIVSNTYFPVQYTIYPKSILAL